jgi:hypothetical protein
MTEHSDETRDDLRHDPAHHAGGPDDLASQGGAVSEGPATHPADVDETEQARRSSDGTED